jgi:hypothetical protein
MIGYKIKWLRFLVIIFLPVLFFLFLFSCERDDFQTGKAGLIRFSNDTVMFDTIFTDIGTATYRLMVYNPNNFRLEVDSVYLSGREKSSFRLNIDGQPTPVTHHLMIGPKDSLYIFIQAYIPGTIQNNPFLNEDSIVFVSGQNTSNVKLWAVGQNVIPFHNDRIQNQEWFNSKPYLIFGTLTVDSAATLKIHEGVRVYFHKNAKLIVNGTLQVYGLHDAPVLFRGDRLEKDYDSIPGLWGGIELFGADQKHVIDFANIRNGTTGLLIGSYQNSKKVQLSLSNSKVMNMAYSSLIAYQADIDARNCVLANSKNSLCQLLYGGKYHLLHCTLADYGAMYVGRDVNAGGLVLQNFITYLTPDGKEETRTNDLKLAYFDNTIVYGSSDDEIFLDSKTEATFNYTFENSLIKILPSNPLYKSSGLLNCVVNKSPKFINPDTENFRLDTLSAAKDTGKPEIGLQVPIDLDNNSRTSDKAPDIGAYERKEK